MRVLSTSKKDKNYKKKERRSSINTLKENTTDGLIVIDTGSCVHLFTQKDLVVDFQPISSTTAKQLYYGVGDARETNPIAIRRRG